MYAIRRPVDLGGFGRQCLQLGQRSIEQVQVEEHGWIIALVKPDGKNQMVGLRLRQPVHTMRRYRFALGCAEREIIRIQVELLSGYQ